MPSWLVRSSIAAFVRAGTGYRIELPFCGVRHTEQTFKQVTALAGQNTPNQTLHEFRHMRHKV